MRFGPAGRNQLFSHAHRKRQIGEAVAVLVAELATAESELDAAESMRTNAHTLPPADGLLNLVCD